MFATGSKLTTLAIALVFLFDSTTCFGWGSDGHVIVAKIAELNLNDKAKDGIAKLLGPIPISHQRIATYADFVKHNSEYPQYAKSAPWHYINIPIGKKNPARLTTARTLHA